MDTPFSLYNFVWALMSSSREKNIMISLTGLLVMEILWMDDAGLRAAALAWGRTLKWTGSED